jgi:hypothetical protein
MPFLNLLLKENSMNNLIHATYKTFPNEVPEVNKPILVVNPIYGEIAPFVYQETDTGVFALRVYGKSNIGIPLEVIPTFLWVDLDDLLPQSIN